MGSDGVLREVLRQALRPHGTHQAPDAPAEPPWSPEQWNEAFSYLFLASPGSRHAVLEHQDDMLWFVTAPPALAAGTAPVTLRRNVSSLLPPELRPGGRDFGSVDWAASVQLNLVVQATFILTVVQCEESALAAVAQASNTAPGTYRAHLHELEAPAATGDSLHSNTSSLTLCQEQHARLHGLAGTVVAQRRVYASPMSADVNLEDAKAGRPPAACYPDVSFSVDNFESGFEDMVLSRTGDCYCVMLHVHAAATTAKPSAPSPAVPPSADSASHSVTSTSSTEVSGTKVGRQERRATLFSAYVTREQVAAYIATKLPPPSKPSLLNRLLGAPAASSSSARSAQLLGRKERVVMSGPAGVGRAEALAVTVGAPLATAEAAPAAGAGSGIGARGGGSAPQALQMSLMWMSLPAHALARAVLQFACEAL